VNQTSPGPDLSQSPLRRFMVRLPRRAVGLPLAFLLFGCALQDGYASRDYDVERASRIFRTGYQDVVDVYIEDLRAPELALAGLDGLSNLDPAVSISYGDHLVTLKIKGQAAGRFDAPHPDDTDGWGALTANAIEEFRHDSEPLNVAKPEAVYQAVFSGMITELDGFYRYAGRERARENRASRDGFGGIGVRIRVVDEGVKVLSVMEDTPAEAAGLEDQDLITEINGQSAVGLSQDLVVQRLRGPVRTTVLLTVTRPSMPARLTFSLTRAHIVPQTVSYRAEGNVGYLRVSGFNQSTAQTLREKILQAKREQGKELEGFILDLRGNPGGLLDQAVSVSDLFITHGRIVSTHGRHPDSHQFFDARKDDLAAGLPIAILVNGNSASASEIVAAALQDAGRGVLIGSNSFGKGTVQTVLRLPNEGELTLTWARFHAPSGYALQNRGVLPDICTSGEASDATGLLERVRRGDMRVDRAARSRSIAPGDEAGLSALRAQCPVSESDPEVDLQVALGLLGDVTLYAQALRGGPTTAERTTN
jgi:carboxyl-terminal processing protease